MATLSQKVVNASIELVTMEEIANYRVMVANLVKNMIIGRCRDNGFVVDAVPLLEESAADVRSTMRIIDSTNTTRLDFKVRLTLFHISSGTILFNARVVSHDTHGVYRLLYESTFQGYAYRIACVYKPPTVNQGINGDKAHVVLRHIYYNFGREEITAAVEVEQVPLEYYNFDPKYISKAKREAFQEALAASQSKLVGATLALAQGYVDLMTTPYPSASFQNEVIVSGVDALDRVQPGVYVCNFSTLHHLKMYRVNNAQKKIKVSAPDIDSNALINRFVERITALINGVAAAT